MIPTQSDRHLLLAPAPLVCARQPRQFSVQPLSTHNVLLHHAQYTLTDDAFKLSHKLQIKDHILRFMFLCMELQHGTQQFILIDLRMLTRPSKVSLSVPVCSFRKICTLLARFKHSNTTCNLL